MASERCTDSHTCTCEPCGGAFVRLAGAGGPGQGVTRHQGWLSKGGRADEFNVRDSRGSAASGVTAQERCERKRDAGLPHAAWRDGDAAHHGVRAAVQRETAPSGRDRLLGLYARKPAPQKHAGGAAA
ncbi:unnamed protein product [Pedinophyceae sp. YPF-701]|nr:unnamed protein product [Pedinophyceae sp. YPF-701]